MRNEYLGDKTLALFILTRLSKLFVFGFLLIAAALAVGANYLPAPILQQVPHLSEWFLGLSGILVFLSIVFAVIAVLVAYLEYTHYTFELTEHALIISTGIINKKEVSMPYRQIQSVDLSRDLFDQLVGLSKIVILTAGEADQGDAADEEPRGILPAIDSGRAEELQQELLKRADIEKVSAVAASTQ